MLTLILLGTAGLIIFATLIWTDVLAFKRHWAWGGGLVLCQAVFLGANFLPPETQLHYGTVILIAQVAHAILYLTFLIMAWSEARHPFLWSLASLPVVGMAVFSLPSSGPHSADTIAGEIRSRGLLAVLLDHAPVNEVTKAVSATLGREPSRFNSVPAQEPPPKVFQSRLPQATVVPGQPEIAPPGTYYLLQRVVSTNASGFRAANVGEKVTLVDRLPNQKLIVTVGGADFTVTSAQVTDDLSVAREAEKEDFILRGGKL